MIEERKLPPGSLGCKDWRDCFTCPFDPQDCRFDEYHSALGTRLVKDEAMCTYMREYMRKYPFPKGVSMAERKRVYSKELCRQRQGYYKHHPEEGTDFASTLKS